MEDQLLQQPAGSGTGRVRGALDRRLRYAVGDLRGDRRQRVDGNQRHPARSEYVHVVLLQSSHADPRPACELHTHKLWKSYADANGDGDCHGHCNISHSDRDSDGHCNISHSDRDSDSNVYANGDGDSNGYTNCDCAAEVYANATAASDAAAPTVGSVTN